jgi:hypothetical protein
MVEDRSEGVRVEPWRRQNVGAALALEQEGEPERDIGSVRWIERLERALYYHQSQLMYKALEMRRGVSGADALQATRGPQVFVGE